MSLDISDTLSQGIDHTFSDAGAKLIGLVAILTFITSQIGAGIAVWAVKQQDTYTPAMESAMVEPLFGAIHPLTGLLFILLLGVVGLMVNMGGYRAFISDGPDQLDSDDFTDNFAWILVNMFIGGLITSILIFVGFILLIIPGFFLMVSLLFFPVFVIVEGENAIEALKSSWGLASGNRIPLFIIGVLITIVFVILGSISSLFGMGLIGQIISALIGALQGVLQIALIAAAFELLIAESETIEATV